MISGTAGFRTQTSPEYWTLSIYLLFNSLGSCLRMLVSVPDQLLTFEMVVRVASSCLSVITGCMGKKEYHGMIIN